MTVSYDPTELHGQIAVSGSEVELATSIIATYFWVMKRLTLTNISASPVSASLTYDGLLQYPFDIPAEEVVEFVWGDQGYVIREGKSLSITVDTVDVINYKLDGLVGNLI
jgi:hypothetical protein